MKFRIIVKKQESPIYITMDGRGDTVLLNIEEFKQMQAELEVLKNLAEAEDDVRNNRIMPIKDTFWDLRKKLEE